MKRLLTLICLLFFAQFALAELPTIRAYVARGRIRADMARTLRDDTLAAMAAGRPDTMLRVMEV